MRLMIEYVLPHSHGLWPEGHMTRAGVVVAAVPGVIVTDHRLPGWEWDAAIFDTYGSAVPWVPREAALLAASGVPLVSIARALSNPPMHQRKDWALAIQPGPYEFTFGEIIPPLVDVSDVPAGNIDVLAILSRWPEQEVWWHYLTRILADSGMQYIVLSHIGLGCPIVRGRGSDWIAGANVVIGGAGAGTLYETLWAGKRLVAKAFCREQQIRLTAAIAAGESVVEVQTVEEIPSAIERVRSMEPIGRRETGAQEFARLLEGIL